MSLGPVPADRPAAGPREPCSHGGGGRRVASGVAAPRASGPSMAVHPPSASPHRHRQSRSRLVGLTPWVPGPVSGRFVIEIYDRIRNLLKHLAAEFPHPTSRDSLASGGLALASRSAGLSGRCLAAARARWLGSAHPHGSRLPLRLRSAECAARGRSTRLSHALCLTPLALSSLVSGRSRADPASCVVSQAVSRLPVAPADSRHAPQTAAPAPCAGPCQANLASRAPRCTALPHVWRWRRLLVPWDLSSSQQRLSLLLRLVGGGGGRRGGELLHA